MDLSLKSGLLMTFYSRYESVLLAMVGELLSTKGFGGGGGKS